MSEARILVVDDDLATRMIVGEALLSSDLDVIEAEDGVAALEMFETHRPDAILLDLTMPNLDGYDVCKQIRELFGDADVPIMVMTASEDLEAVERAFAAGATDFMTKPVNLRLLPYRMRYMLRSAHTTDVVREIARQLVQSQALARLVHWHVLVSGDFEWANDPMPVLCPTCPTAEGVPPSLIDLVHPDDRLRVASLLAVKAPHSTEFRIVLPDGTERVMQQRATLGDASLGIALFGATQDITEHKRAEQQVAKLAYYDDLTGIPNRRLIERYLEVAYETPRFAISIELGIAALQLGEQARDRLTRAAVARVIDRVRGNDFRQRLDAEPRAAEDFGSIIVGRTGLDELVVIATGDCAAMARAVEGSLAIPFTINDTSIRIPARIGTASYPDPVARAGELPEAARIAMQDAAGRTGVYSRELQARRARTSAIGRSLDLALACAPRDPSDAMTVRYEARVESRTHRLIGRRAHTMFDRELRDDMGALLASDPVRAARVMMWTLTRALGEAAAWPEPLRLTGAMSCTQLAATGGLQMMELALAEAQFDPARLDLELVDLPEASHDFDAVATVLDRLRERGIGIGLRVDDRTPLHALRRLPLTFVRVDPSSLCAGLLPAVVAAAETLGLAVVATGVDNATRKALLADLEIAELSGAVLEAPVVVTASTVDTCLAVS